MKFNLSVHKLADGSYERYAWPGGYPLAYGCSDGGTLCAKCVEENEDLILSAIKDHDDSGWRVEAVEANWEDPELYCDNCGDRIESAYAEDEAKG